MTATDLLDPVTVALDRISPADPVAAQRAGEALSVLLAGVRGSCWPEIAWRYSRLGAGGCPIEFSFTSADPALRYTVESSGPETAPAECLPNALRHIRRLVPDAEVPGELAVLIENAQAAADLRWGAWVGARHSASGSSYKLYAELPRRATAAQLAGWPFRLMTSPLPGHEARLEGLGYDLSRRKAELYYRASRLDMNGLRLLLGRAGLGARQADLLDLLGEVLGRPARAHLPSLRFGFSLATGPTGGERVVSLFCYTYEALGDDARCRSRILSVAERRGLTLGAYPEMSALLMTASGRHRHTVIAVSVGVGGPPVLTVALSPPDGGTGS